MLGVEQHNARRHFVDGDAELLEQARHVVFVVVAINHVHRVQQILLAATTFRCELQQAIATAMHERRQFFMRGTRFSNQ